ncbi:hypothetical protein PTI98_001788 [Pleurotus ostreatus]|nr:hypothetical protein PTI98_001788 [Pleurotus ostreatus]
MWCTRWFLPLLFLPIPTASPYFLVLFILSLTMHAKPCFYCIILLTTLFISSCYWQPFTLDTPLAIPWSENITTFGAALNATLSKDLQNITLPSTIRVIDRCWCDFSTNGFFEPYNVTQWEWNSVDKLKTDLEKQAAATLMLEFAEKDQDGELASPAASLTTSHVDMPRTAAPNPASQTPTQYSNRPTFLRQVLWVLLWPLVPKPEFGVPVHLPHGFVPQPDPSEASAATFPPKQSLQNPCHCSEKSTISDRTD